MLYHYRHLITRFLDGMEKLQASLDMCASFRPRFCAGQSYSPSAHANGMCLCSFSRGLWRVVNRSKQQSDTGLVPACRLFIDVHVTVVRMRRAASGAQPYLRIACCCLPAGRLER